MIPSHAHQTIRVLVVDDSAAVRQTLKQVLETDPDIEVMASASDPFVAAERIKRAVPDVITLDIEMPRMEVMASPREDHEPASDSCGDLFEPHRKRFPGCTGGARKGRGGSHHHAEAGNEGVFRGIAGPPLRRREIGGSGTLGIARHRDGASQPRMQPSP